MDENTKYSIIMVLICLGLVILAITTVKIIDMVKCNAQTSQIGYPAKWGLFSGCMIEIAPNQWIPLSAYYYREK